MTRKVLESLSNSTWFNTELLTKPQSSERNTSRKPIKFEKHRSVLSHFKPIQNKILIKWNLIKNWKVWNTLSRAARMKPSFHFFSLKCNLKRKPLIKNVGVCETLHMNIKKIQISNNNQTLPEYWSYILLPYPWQYILLQSFCSTKRNHTTD